MASGDDSANDESSLASTASQPLGSSKLDRNSSNSPSKGEKEMSHLSDPSKPGNPQAHAADSQIRVVAASSAETANLATPLQSPWQDHENGDKHELSQQPVFPDTNPAQPGTEPENAGAHEAQSLGAEEAAIQKQDSNPVPEANGPEHGGTEEADDRDSRAEKLIRELSFREAFEAPEVPQSEAAGVSSTSVTELASAGSLNPGNDSDPLDRSQEEAETAGPVREGSSPGTAESSGLDESSVDDESSPPQGNSESVPDNPPGGGDVGLEPKMESQAVHVHPEAPTAVESPRQDSQSRENSLAEPLPVSQRYDFSAFDDSASETSDINDSETEQRGLVGNHNGLEDTSLRSGDGDKGQSIQDDIAELEEGPDSKSVQLTSAPDDSSPPAVISHHVPEDLEAAQNSETQSGRSSSDDIPQDTDDPSLAEAAAEEAAAAGPDLKLLGAGSAHPPQLTSGIQNSGSQIQTDSSSPANGLASSGPESSAESSEQELTTGVYGSSRDTTAGDSTVGSTLDPEWQGQSKHFFVLSNSGKPILSLHGDEEKLADFMALIHAMISFAADSGSQLSSMRAGRRKIVFLTQGPLYLVAVSTLEEPESCLLAQLTAVNRQILCILTSGFERAFAKSSKFDLRRLLGGTEGVLRRLIMGFEMTPWVKLDAFPAMPLDPDLRRLCSMSLSSALKESGAMYALILMGGSVLALSQSRAHPFAPSDLLVLSNFIMSSESFLQSTESFTPICLPEFNPKAFLHAYVAFLHKEERICLVLLSSQEDSFHDLSRASTNLMNQLSPSFKDLVESCCHDRHGGQLTVSQLPRKAGGGAPGRTPLLHFIYQSVPRSQFIMPAWSEILTQTGFQSVILTSLMRVQSAMVLGKGEPGAQQTAERIHFEQDEECTILGVSGAEYVLLTAFDALTERSEALEICQNLSSWVKANQGRLFVPT